MPYITGQGVGLNLKRLQIGEKRMWSVALLLFSVSIACAKSMVLDPKNVVIRNYMPFNAERRISSYPRITGDTFRAFCTHIIDETQIPFDPTPVKKGDTIFVNGNLLEQFFERVYPQITVPFILVSHNSTRMVPETLAHYLDDEKIMAWFTRNPDRVDHPKLKGLPLGLGNAYFPFGNREVADRVLAQLPRKKKHLLYLGFNPRTHGKTRWHVYRLFKNARFCYKPEKRVSYEQYLTDLSESCFVLSPRGHGLDCYRHWESLLMGAIPIIQRSTLDPLFEDLPVLLIDDWNEISQKFLEKKYKEMRMRTYKLEKLSADFWFDQVQNVALAA